MAVKLVNIGTFANDGTGDDLREAFLKINQNFEDLDLRTDDKTEGENLGDGTGIFKSRLGYNLQFKSLVEGENIIIEDLSDSIRINSQIPDSLQNLPIVTDQGSITITSEDSLRINGGNKVSTTVDTNTKSIIIDAEFNGLLSEDPSPILTSTLNANSQDIINIGTVQADNVLGNLNSVNSDKFQSFYNDLDFGLIDENVTNFYDFLRLNVNVDLGSFDIPTVINIDLGTF